MTEQPTTLELRLVAALNERAATLPPRSMSPPEVATNTQRSQRPRHAMLAGVAIAAALIGITLVTRELPNVDSTSPRRAPRIAAAATTPAPTPPPAGVTGRAVPLSSVSISESDSLRVLIRLTLQQDPNAHPIVVQIPGRDPMVISSLRGSRCATVASTGMPAEGSCLPSERALAQIVGTIDTGPFETPTSVAYGAWTNVPAETAYVTFSYGTQQAWQRPVDGVSYFTIPGYRPPLGGEPVVYRAFDAAGTQVGEATMTPYLDGSGQWMWGS